MRIDRIRLERGDAWWTASARLQWDRRRREPAVVTYEVRADRAEGFVASADAFLLAAVPLAMTDGEPEIVVDGVLSPRLVEGVERAMERYVEWMPGWRPMAVEASGGSAQTTPGPPATALFLSGGVDSLALLQQHRTAHPVGDAAAIRTGLHIFGLNTYDHDSQGHAVAERWARFQFYLERLQRFAEATDIDVVAMRTNIRTLYPEYLAWAKGYGMGIAAAAHLFPGRFSEIWLADHGRQNHVHREQLFWLEDCATEALRIRLGQPDVSRMQKVGALTQWPEAMRILRPCVYKDLPPEGRLNCGQCAKCARTRLILAALGAREAAVTLPLEEVGPESVAAVDPNPSMAEYLLGLLPEIAEGLRVHDRRELLAAVEDLIERCERIAEGGPSRRPGLVARLLGRLGLR